MDHKQRLFIYDRREVFILFILGLMVAAFAFTLGVHLGKRVTTQAQAPAMGEVSKTATLQDAVPNRQELTEQGQNAQAAADEEMSQALHQEVEKSGIKLKSARQVDLPGQTKSSNAGATSITPPASEANPPSEANPSSETSKSIDANETAVASNPASAADLSPKSAALEEENVAVKGKFTLQVGSFPSPEEAKAKMDELRVQGAHPFVRSAQVKGIGKRFRLFLGDFSSREEADKAGKKYQSQRMIDSYFVSRLEE